LVLTGRDRGVREVREDAVDAQLVELPVLRARVAAVVRGEARALVAERPRVHLEAARVGALDQRGGGQEDAIGLVDGAVAVLVADLAVAVGVARSRRHDVALPGPDRVRVEATSSRPGVVAKKPKVRARSPGSPDTVQS
jgi:hypothetical protein